MSRRKLLTDSEYLDSLFDVDRNYHDPTSDPKFLEGVVEAFSAAGVLPKGTDVEAHCRALFDPRKNFRGDKVQLLMEAASKVLPSSLQHLMKVPVGFLHLNELNGFAAPTPRGNAVIVVNLGVVRHAGLLGRCALALTTYGSATPYCRDHEPTAFFHAIVCLARYAQTGDPKHLAAITVWECPSLPFVDVQVGKVATLVELFVLLHEYGHVARGHLKAESTITKLGVRRYAQSHEQEYQADAFAFRHLAKHYGVQLPAFGAALLFRFFDLIEHIVYGRPAASDTHPAGLDRWAAVKKTFKLDDAAPTAFGEVEAMFDMAVQLRDRVDGAMELIRSGHGSRFQPQT